MKKSFTLSEVLITLVIIGAVAAITVPCILVSIENNEHKVNYKKAYSDLTRASLKGIAFGEFPLRETKFDTDTTLEEWEGIKKSFSIAKLCESNNAWDCIDEDGEQLHNDNGVSTSDMPSKSSKVFIDAAGRAWVLYNNTENIFLVDTNGNKKPNRFGKDRWIFTFADNNNERICSEGSGLSSDEECSNPSLPYKVIPYFSSDKTTESNWCHYPPCRYYSWLYK